MSPKQAYSPDSNHALLIFMYGVNRRDIEITNLIVPDEDMKLFAIVLDGSDTISNPE